MHRERNCSGTSGKSNTRVTLCDKIHTKIGLCREREKKGRKKAVNFFEKAHRGFCRKSKNRNLFWVYTAGNGEGFSKEADSTVVLYCELKLATQKSN